MAFEQDWDDPPGQRSGNPFRWTHPRRSEATVTPTLQVLEQQILEVTGAWNNVDVYFTGPLAAWHTAFTIVRLYAVIGGAPYLIEEVTLGTLVPPAVILTATGFRGRVLRARGRPSDGYRVTVTPPPSFAPGIMPPATFTAYAWGTETADVVEAEIIPGPDPIPVVIDGPDPLNVAEIPADTWSNAKGIAPDGSVALTTAAPIAAGPMPVERYVDVSSSFVNPPGSVIYVFSSAALITDPPGYQLQPGDTATIEIDDASKIFVLGSGALLEWIAAVT